MKKVGSATKKLISSTMNINEISEDCGFSDTVYFRRIFKKITGLTPAKYRKMYSHIHLNTE
jgi:YesN/AraC family two-component response regulator